MHRTTRALQSIWLSLLVTVLVLIAQPCFASDSPEITPPKGLIPYYKQIELKDGRTLLVGCDRCEPNGRADESSIVGEVYDPKTRTFSNVGKMVAPRCAANVVVLPTQEVLFVGGGPCNGIDRYSFEKVVEIFNPASGRFSKVGELHTRRASPSATMLHNGQVLIAGGFDADQHLLREAEIYDPQEHRLHLVGGMVFPRCEAARVVLSDGSVLFAGGYKCNWPPDSMDKPYEVLKTAERYDPDTARFYRAGDMTRPRVWAAPILLRDGRVLIVGGRAVFDWETLSDADIYDLRTNAFTRSGKMTAPRAGPILRLMNDGEVLVKGGAYKGPPGADYIERSSEIYDPSTNSFRPEPR
jgi:Galactose oxidase, central domain